MIVKIVDHYGPICITVDAGTTIYNLIKDSTDVVLDFKEVTTIMAPFANFVVGRLLEHRTLNQF
jgi:cell division GTPase FtsZ